MKKLFTLLAAIILVCTFNLSADCWIIGAIGGKSWNPTVGHQLTQSESDTNIYSGEIVVTETLAYFGIATKLSTSSTDWSTLNANRYGGSSNELAVTVNAENSFTKNENCWTVPAGTYTFTVNFTTNKLTVSDGSGEVVVPEEVWRLVGSDAKNLNASWDPASSPKFTMVSDGVYELELDELVAGAEFKVVKGDSWGTDYGYGKIEVGKEYTLSGSSNITFSDGKAYKDLKFTWIPDTKKFKAEGTASDEVVETVWCLVGAFNNWDVTNAPEFTKVSDGVYEIFVETLNGEFKIAADHAWGVGYGTNGESVVVGEVYNLYGPSGAGNLTFEGDKTYTDCTLTFNSVDKTLLVEGTEQAAITDFEQVYMVGDMNSWNFAACPDVLTREEEGSKIYKGTVTMTAASGNDYCYWRIYEQLNQIGSWGLETEVETPAHTTSATLVRLATGALTTLPGKYDVVFNMETGEVTLTPFEYLPATETRTEIFYESFDQCDSVGGNDGSWSGINNSATLTTDNDGWSSVKGFGASKCARFGTGSAAGSAVTPAITGLNGDAVLTFKAGAWNASSEKTQLNLSISEGTLNVSSVTLVKGEFNEYVVEISGGTSASQITFSANTAKNNRFFLDEVKIEKVETALAAPIVEFAGLKKADNVYYDNVTISTNMPENAEFVKFQIFENSESTEAIYSKDVKAADLNEDGLFVYEVTTSGEVRATAYSSEYYAASTVAYEVVAMEEVADLATFIEKADKDNYVKYTGTATVTYQNGGDMYMQDETSAIMVYGAVGKEYNNGDQLTNIIGKYASYNGLHEMIPYAESFGEATEGTTVEPAEVAVTEVSADNQNRYVVLKGVAFTMTSNYQGTVADADGNTLTVRGDSYSGTFPASGNYDIVGITSAYNGTAQLKPISFTEVVVVPTFEPVSVTPAPTDIEAAEDEWNFHESISEIVFTFEEAVTLAEEADLTVYSRFGMSYVPTVTVEETVVTLSFEEAIEAQGIYSLYLAEGTFTTESGAKNAELNYYFAVQPAPISYDFAAPTAVAPEAGVVESLSTITLTFAENIAVLYPYETGHAYIEDANENVYAVSMEYGEMNDMWQTKDVLLVLEEEITAAGTYTLTIPEGLIGDEVAGNSDFAYGKANATLQYVFTIEEKEVSDAVSHAVPAGAEGYINYVEGQWADGFPFTVATGENNTLIFSAELSSFPENIMGLEVKEVEEGVESSIAALNAVMRMDATEENTAMTFTGETTKEYTDGEDISFRFSFLLADNSTIDTITFEYTVGGDTITGVNSVVIGEGDVKVVGGSIVAPEGAEIYNVNGVRVNGENVAAGIYVVKVGNDAVKVIVK